MMDESEMERAEARNKPPRLSPWTLRFSDQELEARFVLHHTRNHLMQARLIGLLAVVLFSAFAVVDYFVLPAHIESLWATRIAVVSVYAAAIAFTFWRKFKRYFYRTISFCVVVAASALLYFLTPMDREDFMIYYAYLGLTIIASFGLSGNSFRNGFILTVLTLVAFNLVCLSKFGLDQKLLIVTNLFLGSIALMSAMTGFYLERHERHFFYQLRATDAARRANEHRAQHDALTGLPNRDLFARRLESAILGANAGKSLVALLFIDLNNFKSVNDRYGHAAGDQVLREFAFRLQKVVRRSDTIARYGGDEYLVLLADLESPDAVTQVVENITEKLESPYFLSEAGQEIELSASIGIAYWPEHGISSEELLAYADANMYQRKNNRHKS